MTTESKATARLAACVILLTLSFLQTTKAQNCQAGYEMRTLKCNGHFQERCMPVNYSCKDCWKLETAPCPGSGLSHGGLTDYNSYESAYAAAERNKNNALNKGSNYDCIINDPRTYRVYLDDKSSCGDPAIVTNLKNKIAPFLKRFEAEIAAYKNFLAGKPYKPGGVIAEYRDALRRAEDDYNRLSLRLNDMTDENLSEFEAAFNDAQNIEIQLKQVDTNYRNEQQQEAEQQRQRELAQQQAQQQEAAKQRREQQEEQRRQEEQRQALRNQIIQQQQQVQQQTNQSNQNNIQQMSNTLTQGLDNIMAEEARKEQARQEQLRQQQEDEAREKEAERQRQTVNNNGSNNQLQYYSQDEYDKQQRQNAAAQMLSMTDKGKGAFFRKDYATATSFLRQAYDNGDRCEAAYWLGWSYFKMNQGAQAITYLETVTGHTGNYDVSAATNIAEVYRDGLYGVPKDAAKAMLYFQKGVSLGAVEDISYIGDIYRRGGNNVPKDINKAIEKYTAAADAGVRAAMNALGEIYLERKDYATALNWFKKSGNIEYTFSDLRASYVLPRPEAIQHLGEIYENGWGVTKDMNAAYFDYRSASRIVDQASAGFNTFDEKGEIKDIVTMSYADLSKKLEGDIERVSGKLTGFKPSDITGTWNYYLMWPSAHNFTPISGKMTITVAQDGKLIGTMMIDPGQRLSGSSTFSCEGIFKTSLNFAVQASAKDIKQVYSIIIHDKNLMMGYVDNIVPPGSDRPPLWDISASIMLSR